MAKQIEARSADQEPIVAAVNQVVEIFDKEGLIPEGTLVLTYQFPCPYFTPPPGIVSRALETGYGIIDARDARQQRELGVIPHLVRIEPMHGQLDPKNPDVLNRDHISIWLNPQKIGTAKAARIRKILSDRSLNP